MNAKYGRSQIFPRSETVDIHVRELTLTGVAGDKVTEREYIEVREYIKPSEVYGHGIVIPRDRLTDLQTALYNLTRETVSE